MPQIPSLPSELVEKLWAFIFWEQKLHFKKTQFLIIFENLNAHNFSSNWDEKVEFTALKRVQFFLPIKSIQLMYQENKFLNNSTKMMKIKGLSAFFFTLFYQLVASACCWFKNQLPHDNLDKILFLLKWILNLNLVWFSNFNRLKNFEKKIFNQSRSVRVAQCMGKHTYIDSVSVA